MVEKRSQAAGDGVSGRGPRNSKTSSEAIITLQAREEERAYTKRELERAAAHGRHYCSADICSLPTLLFIALTTWMG